MKLIVLALLQLNDLSVIYTDISRYIFFKCFEKPLETFMETSLANHSLLLFVSYLSSFPSDVFSMIFEVDRCLNCGNNRWCSRWKYKISYFLIYSEQQNNDTTTTSRIFLSLISTVFCCFSFSFFITCITWFFFTQDKFCLAK